MNNVQNDSSKINSNPPRGGQHSLGLFGIPGATAAAPRKQDRAVRATPLRRQNSASDLMALAQLAADERERFVPQDLEEWGRPVAWGHMEIALAFEG